PPRTEIDQELARWHDEAVGYKIRYIPANLPDLAKTPAVNSYEYEGENPKTSDQAMAATLGKLEYTEHPDSDMEICMPRQALEIFVAGQGQWSELKQEARIEQLDHLRDLVQELYPGLRIYLYDAREFFSAPYTVFGPKRAAIYIGQMYFVFNTTDHIRVLIRHFDDLVRAATVQCNEITAFLDQLRARVAR
ncbi:MAG: transcriptional regulator, partial [Gammaproteobacteria bacterium]|nr:transcriptional regulator [Gammaproteobacteria bacterium]